MVVQKAQQEVFIAEEKIRQNEAEIQQTIKTKKTYKSNCGGQMWSSENHLHWCKQKAILSVENF